MRTQVVVMDADDIDRRFLMLGVADVLVYRALERAGNRLRSSTGRAGWCDTVPHQVHTAVKVTPEQARAVLRHAWEQLGWYTTMYGCCGVSALQVEAVLDEYVIGLMVSAEPHSTARLAAALRVGYPEVFTGMEFG